MADEKDTTTTRPKSKSTKPDGDPTAEPGSPEHLGSDRPYEGAPYHGEGVEDK